MGKMMKCFVTIFASVSMLLALVGCDLGNEPPKIEDIETRFDACRKDIELVTEYLILLDFEDAMIDDDDETYFSDFEWRDIEDTEVCSALDRLWENGVLRISKRSDLNSISFTMWSGIRDINCGVTYPINSENTLSVEYLTELHPLKDGWSYYVANYNEWRSNGKTQIFY